MIATSMTSTIAHCDACGWQGIPDDLRVSLGAQLVCSGCGRPGVRVEWAPIAQGTRYGAGEGLAGSAEPQIARLALAASGASSLIVTIRDLDHRRG